MLSARRKEIAYRKFTWVGNQISAEDMAKLYHIKKERRMPITRLVATAVKEFIEKTEKEEEENHVQES